MALVNTTNMTVTGKAGSGSFDSYTQVFTCLKTSMIVTGK